MIKQKDLISYFEASNKTRTSSLFSSLRMMLMTLSKSLSLNKIIALSGKQAKLANTPSDNSWVLSRDVKAIIFALMRFHKGFSITFIIKMKKENKL
jgi:hypothetical protein